MVHELTDEELLDKFESETNIVRTRADELLKLVKQRRELSFEDAAKALNVSVQTIESWANFLEEEKILSIKYNFTTPFITVFHEKIKAVPETGTLQKEIIEKKELNKAALLKEEELSEINRMLAEAYSCLKKGQFDKAKEIYAQIKKQYDDLPLQFLEKKKELNTTLTRLSKDLSLNLSKASLKEMEKKSQNIRKLLKMLEQKIEKREVLNAIKIYGQIKIIYNSLPEGFLEQKLILQNKIIEIYERLITIREEQDIMDTSVKKSEIINLLEELKQSMNEKNIPLAIKLYEKVRELYNSLPKGFLQEKAELQARIIRLYEELLS
ncbi:DeoR family transcriptional regulator, partial [Candidatus Woesearchaeota archaeon]|nr:DeoR family transcriptional regulator [Candidatus Woesearchaeota archaeon]